MAQNTDNTIYFNFSYFALRLLGKGLYSNHWTAIAELVANGLDAQATSVKIYFNMIDKKHSTIEIFDNGTGMNYRDLSEKYVLLGKDKREDQEVSDDIKKELMGRKGIGKLAALYLSHKYYLVSKKNGEATTAWCLDASSVKDSDIPHLNRCNDAEIGIECFEEWNKQSQGTLIKLTNVDLSNFGERSLAAFEARLADFYLTDSLHSSIEICVIDTENQRIEFEKVSKSIAYKNFCAFFNNTNRDYSDKLSEGVIFPSDIPEIMDKKRKVHILDVDKFEVSGKQKFRLKDGTVSEKEFEYTLVGWIGIHTSIKKEEAIKNDPDYLRNKVYRPNQLRLYVRKKLAVENFLDYVKNTQAFSNYIEGEISFDILDDNELGDIATSNRQGFVEDDERVQLLIKLLKPIINSLIRTRVSIGTAINVEEKNFIQAKEARLKQEKADAERKQREAEIQKRKEEQLRREAELKKQEEEERRKRAELAEKESELKRQQEEKRRKEAELKKQEEAEKRKEAELEKKKAEIAKLQEENRRKAAEQEKQAEEERRKQAELEKQHEELKRKEEERKRAEAERQKALEKERADALTENLNSEKKRNDFLFDSLDDNQIEFAKRLHMLKINSAVMEEVITKYLMKLKRNKFSMQDAWDCLKKISYQNKRIQAVLSYGAVAKFNTKAEFTEGNLFGFIEEYCIKILDRHKEISVVPVILDESEFVTKFAPQDIVVIIDNVLSNSEKHNATTLRVEMKCVDSTACIDFIDDGKGVSASVKDLDELFEFGKGYTFPGTGVGLYHIKDIVTKNMNGTVSISSEPGKGFTLHVRIK